MRPGISPPAARMGVVKEFRFAAKFGLVPVQ